jgi:hypothetical protein
MLTSNTAMTMDSGCLSLLAAHSQDKQSFSNKLSEAKDAERRTMMIH